MRLRENVRPPQRYTTDNWSQPQPVPIPRAARPAFKPPFVEYDPKLPPAVFPTLDAPRPSVDADQSVSTGCVWDGEQQDQNAGEQYMMSGALNPSSGINTGEGEEQMSWQPTPISTASTNTIQGDVAGEDALMHNLQVGSHQHNPFNVSNFTDIGAPVGQSTPKFAAELWDSEEQYDEFIASCEDDPEDYNPIPAWGNLSARMQVEIIGNLRRAHSWPELVKLLQLTPDEEKLAFEYCLERKRQVDTENRLLNEKHTKQLQALLCIDNLALKESKVPDQLVFRKIEKRYMYDLQQRVTPDYMMCEAWEVLSCRRYLRSIDLNPKLAGEWTNEMARLQPRGLEDEELEWRLTPEIYATGDKTQQQPTSYGTGNGADIPAEEEELDPKVRFINGLSGRDGVDPDELQLQRNNKIPSAGQLNAAQQLFRVRYAKPPRRGGNRGRGRGRGRGGGRGGRGGRGGSNLVGGDGGDPATRLQLRVGAHRAAQIEKTPPGSGRSTPLEQDEGPHAPTPSNPGRGEDVDAFPSVITASVRAASAQTHLPTRSRPISNNNRGGRGAQPLQRQLAGSWTYNSADPNPDWSPCPRPRFQGRPTQAPNTPQAVPPCTTPIITSSPPELPLCLPIRTATPYRSGSNIPSGSTRYTGYTPNADNGPAGFDSSTLERPGRVRVNMDGSPIPPSSVMLRPTPNIPTTPNFGRIREQTTQQPPGYSPITPPRRNNVNAGMGFLDTAAQVPAGHEASQDPHWNIDPQLLSEDHAIEQAIEHHPDLETYPHPASQSINAQIGAQYLAAQQTNINREIGELHPEMETSLATWENNLTTVQPMTDIETREPHSESEAPSHPPRGIIDQQTVEPQAVTTEQTKTNTESGEPGLLPEPSGEAMDIDTEGASQLENTTFVNTTLDDTTATLCDSDMTGIECTTSNLESSIISGENPGTETKRGLDPESVAKGNVKSSSKAAAAAKKKSKPKPTPARTQPRRTAKNGPEPTRELRPRLTK